MKIMQGSGLLIDNEVVKDKSVNKIKVQLVSLLGENEAEMLVSGTRAVLWK